MWRGDQLNWLPQEEIKQLWLGNQIWSEKLRNWSVTQA